MDYLTTKEVCELLNLTPQTIHNLCRKSKIEAVKFGASGGWRISRESVDNFMKGKEVI